MSYRILEARNRLQELAISPVVVQRLRQASDRLDAIASQLSPIRLASKVGDGKERLAVASQRADSSVATLIDGKLRSLKVCAAKLDALSPLAVLGRGFAIAENEAGEILRDASQVSVDDTVKVRLAKGSLKTRVEGIDK